MYKVLAWITVLSLFLIAAAPDSRVEVTLINRSGLPLGIQLISLEDVKEEKPKKAHQYYFTLPQGDKDNPSSKKFEIFPDRYRIIVKYIEYYDPVYDYHCDSAGYFQYTLKKNSSLYFYPCGEMPPNPGDSPNYKVYNWPLRRWFRRFLPPLPPLPGNP